MQNNQDDSCTGFDILINNRRMNLETFYRYTWRDYVILQPCALLNDADAAQHDYTAAPLVAWAWGHGLNFLAILIAQTYGLVMGTANWAYRLGRDAGRRLLDAIFAAAGYRRRDAA
jgi:hypothetical protein